MDVIVDLFVSTAFFASAVRLAVPIIFAGTGEVISERVGILNIGLEGMMLMGAFTGVVGAEVTGSPWLGALAAALGGMAVAALHGLVVIRWSGDQIVSGLALNLGALGLTTYLSRLMFDTTRQMEVPHFEPINIPGLSNIPFFGEVLFQQSPFFYLAVAIAVTLSLVLFRSRPGLRWRASGEDPDALDSVGVSVARTRWGALLLCGALAGLGGGAISLAQLFTFIENMTGGKGFIALALVIVTRWRPMWAIGVALFFGAADAIAVRVQALGIASIPFQVSLMIPFVLTLVAYAVAARSGKPPAALGRPWMKT
ncbi:MAG: ABC transporter permease [Gammaproteobacteria bacterium]|nr:ABC transporter permease [Gammaproteobacteria bacterium]